MPRRSKTSRETIRISSPNPIIPYSGPTLAMSTVGRHRSSDLTYILELGASALHWSFIIKISNTENLHSTLLWTKYSHMLYPMQSSQTLFGKTKVKVTDGNNWPKAKELRRGMLGLRPCLLSPLSELLRLYYFCIISVVVSGLPSLAVTPQGLSIFSLPTWALGKALPFPSLW